MKSVHEIRQRRERLIERADAQRRSLARAIEPLRRPFALADRGIALVRYVRSNPLVLAAFSAVLLVLRPRRAFSWARRGFAVWRTWRMVSQAARLLSAQRTAS